MRRKHLAFVPAVLFLASHAADAAVLNVFASVNTTIQEFIDRAPASFTADATEAGAGVQLPIAAASQLDSTDLSGLLLGRAHSFSGFSDPTRLDEPNPQEFALEAACYSDDDTVSYDIHAAAEELRTAVFVSRARGGLRPEISFDAGGTAVVRSRAFFSGAIVLWAADPAANMDQLESELSFTISASSNPTDEQTVFSATVAASGEGLDVGGPISVLRVSASELGDLGLDADSLSALTQLEAAGKLRIWIIQQQSHAYTYRVTADQEFTLAARLDIALRNTLGGTGVAAVLGRPFANLAGFIETALPGIDGQQFERSLNRKMAAQAPPGSISPPLCGASGLEMTALVIPMLGFLRFSRGRQAHPGK